jgi:FKBP-type peptidyl-prolyl cis-trans isomerase FkpA
MKVGGKAVVTCPPELAYGDEGRPPQMRGGATLVFDIELLEIVKEPPAAAGAAPAAPATK